MLDQQKDTTQSHIKIEILIYTQDESLHRLEGKLGKEHKILKLMIVKNRDNQDESQKSFDEPIKITEKR